MYYVHYLVHMSQINSAKKDVSKLKKPANIIYLTLGEQTMHKLKRLYQRKPYVLWDVTT